MNGQTIFYVVIVVLALVFAAIVWMLSSRSRARATLWLAGLGAVVLIGVSIFLYWMAGGKLPGVSSSSAEQSATGGTTPIPPAEVKRAPNTKWDELQKLAPGLVPNCIQNAGLNEAWDFVSVTSSNEASASLIVAFLLLNSENSQRYQSACQEPTLGTPQAGGAYVALFAQALRSAQLELGKITFSQDEKTYNVTEYLLDDQRLESERWVPQSSPWLAIAGPFPNAPYLLSDMPIGEAGRAIGLIALPTGLANEAGRAIGLDPNRSFTVYYESQSITLPTR
jgi:hypothetical protein